MPVSGDVLRAWRRARGWDVPEMARRLRKAAKGATVAGHDALVRMIRFWEAGQRQLSERYEIIYAAALGVDADEVAVGPAGHGFTNTSPPPGMLMAGTGGEPMTLTEPPSASCRGAAHRRPSRAVEAVQAAMAGDAAGLDIASDGLAELVAHYADVLAIAPSPTVYDELLRVRSFAGSLLGSASRRRDCDLIVTVGWLSSLLAVSAADIGEPAAALVWCSDTERRGKDAGFPELQGWAAFTRALIAFYQGDPGRSADAARRGRAHAPGGSVVHAKLAAQEMRCLAMLGDAEGMAEAKRRAADAIDRIGHPVTMAGVYSIPHTEDPPYTATSLLLVKNYRDAAKTARGLLDTVYAAQPLGDRPTNYARTLLILGLAAAGLGEVEEAAAAGDAALGCGRVVWPTMVLAGKLDRSLTHKAPGAAHTADYHGRYVDAARRLALPAVRSRPAGTAR